jgi:hypothetical protein
MLAFACHIVVIIYLTDAAQSYDGH